MQQVRRALDYLEKESPGPHPLITHQFYTIGKTLFLKRLAELVDLKKEGNQLAFEEILDQYLQRLERDASGLPVRLFPMRENPARRVMLDLSVASGQPVITGTGLLAEVLHGRFTAGETIDELAEDYRLDPSAVKDAIAYIQRAA
jgi:uncharacterized protein (DUF433 family)